MAATDHIWDAHRDVCLKCDRTAAEIIDRQLWCDGTLEYREWLRGTTFVREPILRGTFSSR